MGLDRTRMEKPVICRQYHQIQSVGLERRWVVIEFCLEGEMGGFQEAVNFSAGKREASIDQL